MSLYGDYDVSEDAVTLESSATMVPVRGHAKSGRNDLKQMVLLLATTGAAHFPLWMEAIVVMHRIKQRCLLLR